MFLREQKIGDQSCGGEHVFFVCTQVNGVLRLQTMSVDVMGTAKMLIVLQGEAEELPSALKLTVVKVKGFSFLVPGSCQDCLMLLRVEEEKERLGEILKICQILCFLLKWDKKIIPKIFFFVCFYRVKPENLVAVQVTFQAKTYVIPDSFLKKFQMSACCDDGGDDSKYGVCVCVFFTGCLCVAFTV